MTAERDFFTEGYPSSDYGQQRITAPPSNPMAVARDIVADCFRRDRVLLLRHWRGDFYRYACGVWTEAEDRGIRETAYHWLEKAVYMKAWKNGDEAEPWEPTSRKVNDVIDALKAIAFLDGRTEAPAWLDEASLAIPATGTIVMANGLLHVPTRTLVPHSPLFWSHNALPYDYAENAPYPSRWNAFMNDLWADDTASIETLQEIFGYLAGGGTEQQKIFLFVGPRRSGKGTIGRVLAGILGRHNVAAPTMASLGTNFGLQELITRPLAIISDARLSTRGDASVVVERLLSVSGEDSLTVDRKYRDPWTGRLPTRLMILTNELPKLADSSGALAGRFVLLTLTETFYGRENPALTDELLDEAPAIFKWSLEGLDRLNRRGHFVMPPTSADVIRQMEDLASPVGAFVRTCCELGSDYQVSADELWTRWKEFCADQNQHPGTKNLLGRDLKAAAPAIKRSRLGDDVRVYAYRGIRLLQPVQSSVLRTVGTEEAESDQNAPHRPNRPKDGALKHSQNGGGAVAFHEPFYRPDGAACCGMHDAALTGGPA
jgi:putative DNA primase/helicase